MPNRAAAEAAYFQAEIQHIDELRDRIRKLPFSGCSRREALELASFLIDHAYATDNKDLKSEFARLSIRAWQVARRLPA